MEDDSDGDNGYEQRIKKTIKTRERTPKPTETYLSIYLSMWRHGSNSPLLLLRLFYVLLVIDHHHHHHHHHYSVLSLGNDNVVVVVALKKKK